MSNLEEFEEASRQSEWFKQAQLKQDYVHFLGMKKSTVYWENSRAEMAHILKNLYDKAFQ
ncbi:hypothetical protein L1N85_08665 [Paenibacillus alkaliterrae]|uniref:hypothetical protein n=1 Tax=Paenibacillus alkaliterrae TaxID=320909 RepID=UPI001F16D2AF|nr:hypothetical protein [Paenibacillus alkaliterrae]MCF2938505.1 hypothetical protein [Paenibacillus alkaliterrae]